MYNKLTIVCSGPESSGKTTLATYLRDKYDLPLVDEYAREYLNEHSTPYTREDVIHIGHSQENQEQHARAESDHIVVDTDWLTIEIWLREKYGTSVDIDKDISQKLYLLCYPDLAWEADPQRENPQDRHRLYEIHERILLESGAFFFKVSGQGEERHKRVSDFLERNCLI